jgi:hypothetical protein
MVEYAHRVFHIWNVFPPTGMQAERTDRDWTWWAAEGIAIYYNTKALVDLGYLKGNEHLRDDFNRYVREFLGTMNDAPVAQAFKLWDISTDAYFFVTYRKGALVSLLMDALTRKVTNGNKALDDLMRTLYERYGGMKGVYANKDMIRLLDSMTGFDFTTFFSKYVYGKDRLPLKVMPGDLAVDWPELLRALKLTRFPLMTLSLSSSPVRVGETMTVRVQLMTIDGAPIVNQTVNFYLNSTLIGSGTTEESGIAGVTFEADVVPGTYEIVAYYAGSPLYSISKETALLNVKAVGTSLNLAVPETFWMGKPAVVNATVKDEFGSPLQGVSVQFDLYLDGKWVKIGSASTNGEGLASVEHVFDRAGSFMLRATYGGTVKYAETSALTTIVVNVLGEALPPTTALYNVPLPAIVASIGLVLAAALVGVLLTRRRSTKEVLERPSS